VERINQGLPQRIEFLDEGLAIKQQTAKSHDSKESS
jgi:hypothetical protein